MADEAALRKELLKTLGVDVNAPASRQLAYGTSNLPELRRLLTQGVVPDACRDRTGTTALGIAAFRGLFNEALFLIAHGAKVNAENVDGATPMSMAVYGGSPSVMALMLQSLGDAPSEELRSTVEEACADARAVAQEGVLAVLDAWNDKTTHSELENARSMLVAAAVTTTTGQVTPPKRSRLSQRSQTGRASQSASSRSTSSADSIATSLELRLDVLEERFTAMDETMRRIEHQILAVCSDRPRRTNVFSFMGRASRGSRTSRTSRSSQNGRKAQDSPINDASCEIMSGTTPVSSMLALLAQGGRGAVPGTTNELNHLSMSKLPLHAGGDHAATCPKPTNLPRPGRIGRPSDSTPSESTLPERVPRNHCAAAHGRQTVESDIRRGRPSSLIHPEKGEKGEKAATRI
jgi:hypothetical protein